MEIHPGKAGEMPDCLDLEVGLPETAFEGRLACQKYAIISQFKPTPWPPKPWEFRTLRPQHREYMCAFSGCSCCVKWLADHDFL